MILPRLFANALGSMRWTATFALAGAISVGGPVCPASGDVPVAARGRRADGVVAWIGSTGLGSGLEVVLRSDVDLRARLVMSGQLTGSAAYALVPNSLLEATLQQLVGEILIAREAQRVRVTAPTDREVQNELDRFAREAGGAARLNALLRALKVDSGELQAMARRRSWVTTFLRANLEGELAIDDDSLRDRYEEAEHPFAGRPFEEVRDDFRAWVARRQLEEAVERWISVLSARTPLKVLVRYE